MPPIHHKRKPLPPVPGTRKPTASWPIQPRGLDVLVKEQRPNLTDEEILRQYEATLQQFRKWRDDVKSDPGVFPLVSALGNQFRKTIDDQISILEAEIQHLKLKLGLR